MVRTASALRRPACVIYVHGLGRKPAAEVLKRDWDLALFGGPAGARTRMAYWADLLHPPGDTRPSTDEWPERSWGNPLQRQFSAAIDIKLAARLRRRATEFATRRFVPDIAAYFFEARSRAAIQLRLLDVFTSAAGPYVVIAHSMGTIVAYDVLHALGDAIDVRLWVTLGSPLGIAAVQEQLAQPLFVPHGVRAWRNFADRLDPVAFDRTLSGEFEPAGFVHDEWIINPGTLDLDAFNPHSGTGYLSHPAVRDAVKDAIGDDRFVEATGMNPQYRSILATTGPAPVER